MSRSNRGKQNRSLKSPRIVPAPKLSAQELTPTELAPPPVKDSAIEARLQLILQQLTIYSGTLPPSDELRELEQLHPGFTALAIARWEKQSDHRMWMEKTHLIGEQSLAKWGVIAAVVVVVFAFSTAAFFALQGQGGAAAFLSVGGIATLAGTFLYATISRKNERLRRARIMTGRQELEENNPQRPRQ